MSDTGPERRHEYAEVLVRQRLGGRVGDLCVLVCQEGVILRGRARSYHAKQLAQEAIMHALGLLIVANHIEVHPAPPLTESGPSEPNN
jgi:hypothetical protein